MLGNLFYIFILWCIKILGSITGSSVLLLPVSSLDGGNVGSEGDCSESIVKQISIINSVRQKKY